MYRLVLLFFVAFVIRLFFTGNPGFVADIAFWKSWSLAAADHGIVWTAHNTNINYPPGFIYVLWLMGKAYALFADPHDFNAFWQTNNYLFLLISKLPAIISDLVIGYLIYWFSNAIFIDRKILRGGTTFLSTPTGFPSTMNPAGGGVNGASLGGAEKSVARPQQNFWQNLSNFPLLLSSLFLFNPVSILDSAIWGQVESFGLLFTLLTVILLYKKKPLLGAALFTIGVFMKLQNIIYIPLIYLFIFRHFDFKTLIKSVAISLLVCIIIIFPFLLAHGMERVLLLLTINNDYFPWLSLHAHNPWWIVAGGNMMASDKILTIGILSAKKLGIILFTSIYLFLSILIIKKPSIRNLIAVLCVGIFAFFLLYTQSHERYSYPVLIWLLFLFPFLETKFWRKYTLVLFCLLTIAIFFNLHESFYTNYPDNAIAFLGHLITPITNNLNSILLTLLFLLTLPHVFIELPIIYASIPFLFIILAVIMLNLSYIFKGKVYLSSLKPTGLRQDFGSLQFDRAVNSFQGPKSWNVLSSNYFFYDKGIGTHANSYINYNLAGKFRRFSTDYGLDSEAAPNGSVIFQVMGDSKILFTSTKIGRFDFPQHVDVDVSGIATLSLIVNDAGDGISSDHADWLNPILYK